MSANCLIRHVLFCNFVGFKNMKHAIDLKYTIPSPESSKFFRFRLLLKFEL